MCADLLRGEEDLLPCGVDIGTRGQLDDRAIVGDVLQLALRKKEEKNRGKRERSTISNAWGLGVTAPGPAGTAALSTYGSVPPNKAGGGMATGCFGGKRVIAYAEVCVTSLPVATDTGGGLAGNCLGNLQPDSGLGSAA